MKAIVNFRPRVNPGKLKEIAKRGHYNDLSSFINEAIEEKIRRISENPRTHKLVSDIEKAVFEYNGWKFYKPSAREVKEIKEAAEAVRSGKMETVPLEEAIKRLKNLNKTKKAA